MINYSRLSLGIICVLIGLVVFYMRFKCPIEPTEDVTNGNFNASSGAIMLIALGVMLIKESF